MAAVALARGLEGVSSEREPASSRGAAARLRLGVFADTLRQPRWAVAGLRKIAESELADVVVVVETGGARDAAPFLWRAYCSLDDRLFGSRPDPLETTDLAAELPHGRVLKRPTAATGPASASAWLAEIRAMDLDVAFVLGAVDGDALEGIARYGVWRYCFGADASDPDTLAGVHEIAAGAPVTASGLRVRLPGAEDRLVYQSWSRTFPLSLARTRRNLLPKTGEFAYRALLELRRSGAAWLKSCAPIRADGSDSPPALPGTAKMLWQMSLLGSRIARRALQKLLCVDQWFVAYRFGGDGRWRGDLRQYACMMPPRDRYWADPFPIARDGRYFIFFEELVFARGKAHISVVEVAPDGRRSQPVPVLERPYHLSYPFLIEQGGELFMVPETGRNRAVELYRCTRFPDQWSLEHVLMDDVFFTDATFHRADDRWWMFANGSVNGAEGADELSLFYADRLTGEWRPHRGNPVKSDVRGARPAGRLYRRGTELYRPAQIGVPLYGSGVSINRVLRLTPETYAEEEVERVLPSHPRGLLGVHTLNRAGELCVMDGFIRSNRLHPQADRASSPPRWATRPAAPSARSGSARSSAPRAASARCSSSTSTSAATWPARRSPPDAMPRSRLIMLGTAFETRGGISAVVNTYRAHGLFERWPIEYIATHCDGSPWRKLATALCAMRTLVVSLVRDRNAIVHIHGASRASFWRKSAFMAIALAARCPVIFHLHGGGFAKFYEDECGLVRRRLARFFLERAARVIVLSSQWRSWMAKAMRNPNIVCIANPMQVHPEPSPAVRKNALLFLGRLERAKGVFDLVDAMVALREAHPDVRLTLAGDDVDGVAGYAAGRGVAQAVTFTGWVGPEKKKALLDSAGVFVLPSYAEGSPISLLEAMAAGLPAVATAVGGIPDVVADGVNGVLIEPGDVETLVRVLRKLLDDRMLRSRLGAAARETVRLRFDADHVIGELEKIYASLGLARTGKGRVRRAARALREAA